MTHGFGSFRQMSAVLGAVGRFRPEAEVPESAELCRRLPKASEVRRKLQLSAGLSRPPCLCVR
eukprot:11085217-Alexandrium_andersonii.AAC.1